MIVLLNGQVMQALCTNRFAFEPPIQKLAKQITGMIGFSSRAYMHFLHTNIKHNNEKHSSNSSSSSNNNQRGRIREKKLHTPNGLKLLHSPHIMTQSI